MTPSNACSALVQQFEGCAAKQADGNFAAYPDPGTGADPWTIGWGSTGTDIKRGLEWTQAQCDARLASDLAKFAGQVTGVVGAAHTTQHQFDAMVSFAYNVGVANLQSSTLLRLHKAGDYAGAQAQFARWNKAAGKVLSGLTRRRAAEAALYGTPDAPAATVASVAPASPPAPPAPPAPIAPPASAAPAASAAPPAPPAPPSGKPS